jgi:hypothetical protein
MNMEATKTIETLTVEQFQGWAKDLRFVEELLDVTRTAYMEMCSAGLVEAYDRKRVRDLLRRAWEEKKAAKLAPVARILVTLSPYWERSVKSPEGVSEEPTVARVYKHLHKIATE